MKKLLATRTKNLLPSPTIALDTKAKAMLKQGIPIINLSAGEPDFDTPLHIKNAAIETLKNEATKYSAPQGLFELRQAISEKFAKDNNIKYNPEQIIIGSGSKQLLYTIFQVLCDPKDEIIIPIPTWSTFIEQIKLAGGKSVLLKLESPFKLTAAAVEKKLTSKTKIVLLNSPSNPTGAVIDKSELTKIANLAIKNNIFIISDEIYEKLLYTNTHFSIASLNAKIKDRTITLNGVSKSYAMTGWRLGFAGGPKEIIQTMASFQSQSLGNTPTFIQKAALTALTYEQTSVKKMHEEFTERREYLIRELAKIKNISFAQPEGAFYLFVSIEKLLNKKYRTSEEWCKALLEKENVAVVPGEAFMYPGYFRLSFAAAMSDLKKAVEKISRFIKTD